MMWLLASLAGPAQANDDGARRFALVIGSNKGINEEATLRYAADDAERFAGALLRVGDVREEDLVLLRNPQASSVRRALEDLGERTARTPQSVVIVFYSGHASDHALHVGGERLPLQPLVERMTAMPSQVELLVVDACGSGALTRRKGVVAAEPFHLSIGERLDTEGMAILTSSSPGEDAQESEHLQGGVFTHHLVTGLLGAADRSGDGLVTLTEAFEYGYDQTVRTTSVAPFLQHPAFDIQLRGKQDLVVSRLDRATPTRLRLDEPGTWLMLDDDDETLIAELQVDHPVALAVPAGQYVLRRRYEGRLFEADVEVVDGQETRLTASSLRRLSAGETVRKGVDPGRSTAGVLLLGAGMAGPFGIGQGPAGVGQLGLRIDTRALSLTPRILVDHQRSSNGALQGTQTSLGAELSLLRMQHVVGDRLLLGVGVRAGGLAARQRFVTPGSASPETGLVGYLGSVVRLESTIASRWVLGLQGGIDALALQRTDQTLRAVVRPFAAVEVGAYIW